ncbi:MAG: GTP cyclohydrolase I FolE [Planctomycetes bacterium]|nr:GTP cyclohydrolase I FolE [Planctomycetota bacterium]
MATVRSGQAAEILAAEAGDFSLLRTPPPADTPVQELVVRLLEAMGEDPRRDGLSKTPRRVAAALRQLARGYRENLDRILNGALFDVDYDEMVVVRDIDFFSLCEHHLLPFFGKCHVAYLPKKKVVGLSKIPRIVEVFSRRLQVQERLTCQIAETLQERLKPRGVAVVMEAQHLCMMMRGVQKQNAVMLTSSMLGRFRRDSKTRSEFLDLIRGKK